MKNGIDVNAKNKDGLTPFMSAVKNGDLDMAKSLIEMGADVNTPDDHGKTALISAAWYGRLEIAELLIEKGAHLEAKDSLGWTALVQAIFHQYPQSRQAADRERGRPECCRQPRMDCSYVRRKVL
ncbi:MAG: ankyrin repeat domain-containing protein [Pseudomonadota bacterium]